MTYFLSMLVSGLRLGSIYAIVAIGYSIVYGILRLINFAHGDIMTVGVYIILVLMNQLGVPLIGCVIISVGLSILVGLLIERLAYRPLRDASEETTLISSLAVSALLQNLLQDVYKRQGGGLVQHLDDAVGAGQGAGQQQKHIGDHHKGVHDLEHVAQKARQLAHLKAIL